MNIVILTGAGISAESGLATFTGDDGLWDGHKIADVCTPDALTRNPDRVCSFYDERKKVARAVEPNPAHYAIASLQRHWLEYGKGDFLLITQNVDDLHERAGSTELLHMHGELNSAHCCECGFQTPRHAPLETDRECPICIRDTLRPDIVLFGETPRGLPKIEDALQRCDIFVAIGTSGIVHPAAGFVEIAKSHGARTVLLNLEEHQDGGTNFDVCKTGEATKIVPIWTAEMIGLAEFTGSDQHSATWNS